MTTRGAEYNEAETEEHGARARSCVESQMAAYHAGVT
jgi:hypothetical protein